MRFSLLLGWGLICLVGISPFSNPSYAQVKEPLILNHAEAPVSNKHWPGWRGWNTTGISEGVQLPLHWMKDGELDQNWVREIPGRGESSPVVWDDSVCLTYTDQEEGTSYLYAACYSTAAGELKWKRRLQSVRGPRHDYNSYGSSTPATDGQLLFVAIGYETGHLYALDMNDGSELWKQSLGDLSHEYGTSVGPILHKDLVIQLCDSEFRSSLVAFEKKTGEIAWRTPRKSTGSWGTPVVVSTRERDLIVVPGGSPSRWVEGYVRAYDARDGSELWNVAGTTAYVCASPLLGKNRVFCASGRPSGPIHAIRPVLKNGEKRVAWTENRGGAYVPTGIYYKDLIFILSDSGILSAYKPSAEGPQRLYQERIGGEYAASLVAGNGRLYAFSLEGEVNVFEAGPEFKWLARNQMPEPVYATPAVANGRFYVRTRTRLYAIGPKAARGPIPVPEPQ